MAKQNRTLIWVLVIIAVIVLVGILVYNYSNKPLLSPACADSDSSPYTYPTGKNYWIKGSFNVIPYPTDYCQGDVLYEAYCDANGNPAPQQEQVNCANFGAYYKCISGACVDTTPYEYKNDVVIMRAVDWSTVSDIPVVDIDVMKDGFWTTIKDNARVGDIFNYGDMEIGVRYVNSTQKMLTLRPNSNTYIVRIPEEFVYNGSLDRTILVGYDRQ